MTKTSESSPGMGRSTKSKPSSKPQEPMPQRRPNGAAPAAAHAVRAPSVGAAGAEAPPRSATAYSSASLPGVGTPGEAIPGVGTPDEAIPGVGTPGEAIPGAAAAAASLRGVGTPGEAIPGAAAAAASLRGVGTPDEAIPGAAAAAALPRVATRHPRALRPRVPMLRDAPSARRPKTACARPMRPTSLKGDASASPSPGQVTKAAPARTPGPSARGALAVPATPAMPLQAKTGAPKADQKGAAAPRPSGIAAQASGANAGANVAIAPQASGVNPEDNRAIGEETRQAIAFQQAGRAPNAATPHPPAAKKRARGSWGVALPAPTLKPYVPSGIPWHAKGNGPYLGGLKSTAAAKRANKGGATRHVMKNKVVGQGGDGAVEGKDEATVPQMSLVTRRGRVIVAPRRYGGP